MKQLTNKILRKIQASQIRGVVTKDGWVYLITENFDGAAIFNEKGELVDTAEECLIPDENLSALDFKEEFEETFDKTIAKFLFSVSVPFDDFLTDENCELPPLGFTNS